MLSTLRAEGAAIVLGSGITAFVASDYPGTRDGVFPEFHLHLYFTWV
jgi:hypothetical protein